MSMSLAATTAFGRCFAACLVLAGGVAAQGIDDYMWFDPAGTQDAPTVVDLGDSVRTMNMTTDHIVEVQTREAEGDPIGDPFQVMPGQYKDFEVPNNASLLGMLPIFRMDPIAINMSTSQIISEADS